MKLVTSSVRLARIADSGQDGAGYDAALRTPLRVLLVEECAADAKVFERAATESSRFAIETHIVSTTDAAHDAIASMNYDILFLDFWLGCETCVALLDDLSRAAEHKPIIILSNLGKDDIGQIANRAGATGFLSKDDLSGHSIDVIVEELFKDTPVSMRPEEGVPRQFGAPSPSVADELKDLMLSLDAVHAHAAVARGAMEAGDLGEASSFLAHTIEAASSIRRTMFGLVSDLQAQALQRGSRSDIVDACDLTERAVTLVDNDLQSRGVTLALKTSTRPIRVRCDPLEYVHVVETLLAALIWKSDVGSALSVSLDELDEFVLTIRYRPSRVIDIADAQSGDIALNTALSALSDQIDGLGGSFALEPGQSEMTAIVALPVLVDRLHVAS